MSLLELQAIAQADGNEIVLSWTLPEDAGYLGVRVVRQSGSYPRNPDDGINVAEGENLVAAIDSNLKAGEIYYYMLFPYIGAPPVFEVDKNNRTSAMATAPHDYGGYMYELLPAIYHRYDKGDETLKRFLQLSGGQFDQLHSFASAAKDLKDVDNVDGNLLPLLADWIGWKTDNKLEIRSQREEVRHASAIYKTIGLIPTVEATTKRISGWESRTKEFVHNIFSSNRPEQLNLWSMLRDNTGSWSESPELLSLDFAYDGRATSTIDNNGIRWLFYHTLRKGRWEIWYKTSPTIDLSLRLVDQLNAGPISVSLIQALQQLDLNVSPDAVVSVVAIDQLWRIDDTAARYVVERDYASFRVYSLDGNLTSLSASKPIVVGNETIKKYPSVAQQADELWLFWSVYDPINNHWRIEYQSRVDTLWSDAGPAMPDPSIDIARNPFAIGAVYDAGPQRRSPYALVDSADRLWLFWLENNGNGWRFNYNRRDGLVWGAVVSLPVADTLGIQFDFSAVIQPDLPNRGLYLFWTATAETSTPEQFRTQINYIVKSDLNLDAMNWSVAQNLAKHAIDDNHHDREAYAILDGVDIELIWNSNREDSGWSLWRSRLTDAVTNTWDAAERITQGAYSQHNPLPLVIADQTWLIFHSNQAVAYRSNIYGATETFDERYAGSTTMDIRSGRKLALYRQFEDFQHYTYDTGKDGIRTDDNWIARDTIGAYLQNSSLNQTEIENGIERIRPVLEEFMPMTDRAVFIASSELHTEVVYHYDQAISADSYFIGSSYEDEFTSVLALEVFAEGEGFTDSLGTET